MPPATSSRRRFKSPYWDVAPAGYENVTPTEYKAMQAAGSVPHSVVNPSSQILQGTKYAHPDPVAAAKMAAANIEAQLAKAGHLILPGGVGSHARTSLLSSSLSPTTDSRNLPPALTRQARRLYVGNIPFNFTENEMIDFFRTNMEACNFVTEPGNPVLACQINLDKNFAFVEFRTMEETSNAIALDGIVCKGQPLKVRRPHDYQPIPGSEPGTGPKTSTNGSGLLGTTHSSNIPISSVVADSPNKIYVGGLPTHLNDDQVKELLSAFGHLRAFNLIKDSETGASKGFAFCEYLDPSITDKAIFGLNGFDIGDKKLVVQRASLTGASKPSMLAPSYGPSQSPTLGGPVVIQVPGLSSSSIIQPTAHPRVLTEVICLMNMVEPSELMDDQEYEDILDDIRSECKRFGRVRSIEIPRPRKDGEQPPGVGKVFVEFDSPTEAQRAQLNLTGRRFANRIVVTSYFDRDRYLNREF